MFQGELWFELIVRILPLYDSYLVQVRLDEDREK